MVGATAPLASSIFPVVSDVICLEYSLDGESVETKPVYTVDLKADID